MKFLLLLACVVLATNTALASDHGPVFGYATPVNSEREFSFDSGIFGRSGSLGTHLSTGTGVGYGLTPHLTLNVFVPASFGAGSLPESRMMSGGEWSAGASWRFLHSVTSIGERIESTASLALVVPGPQPDSSVQVSALPLPNSTSTSLWLWPSVLAIYKYFAIEGGVQAPLYRQAAQDVYGREAVRFAINISYLKYSSHTSAR